MGSLVLVAGFADHPVEMGDQPVEPDRPSRSKPSFVNILHGLTSVRSIRNKPLFFFYTVGIWCLYLLSTWFGFFAISATRNLSIVDALSVLAMGSVGMIVSPGGIGAYALLVPRDRFLLQYPAPSLWSGPRLVALVRPIS